MKLVEFNTEIFNVLLECGFRYCYSKTVVDEQSPDQIKIVLTPLPYKPDIRKLPKGYDTYFNLKHEPKQMAEGIDNGTFVYIDLDDTLIKACYGKENIDN